VADVAVTPVNVPQAPAGVQLKVTPALEESFVTVTAMAAVVPRPIAVGGAVENTTEIAGGGGGGGGAELPPPHADTKIQPKSNDRAGSCRFIESPEESELFWGRQRDRNQDTGVYEKIWTPEVRNGQLVNRPWKKMWKVRLRL
jgi:hypothetical protein